MCFKLGNGQFRQLGSFIKREKFEFRKCKVAFFCLVKKIDVKIFPVTMGAIRLLPLAVQSGTMRQDGLGLAS